jgi:hypothetical protein
VLLGVGVLLFLSGFGVFAQLVHVGVFTGTAYINLDGMEDNTGRPWSSRLGSPALSLVGRRSQRGSSP